MSAAGEEPEVTQGDALAVIAAESPESLKLLGDLMAWNARDSAWALEQAYEGEKRDHERTKERLERANRQLDFMQYRMEWLMGLHHDPFGDPLAFGS